MPESLTTKLNRISEQAKSIPGFQFKTLAHLINHEMLTTSFQQLRKGAAAGVDGVTAKDYSQNLHANIADLHRRLKAGQYRAQPLRRVYIDKEDGKKRPLSIPALEDKIVQRSVVRILERIYEVDFLPCSYGYRPKKSAREAIDDISRDIIFSKVSFVLDADIKNYFGSIVRKELMTILSKRIQDKAILRLIAKWMRAGAIEDGQLLLDDEGIAQGSIISPLLANVYLHEVLDSWVAQEVRPRLLGRIGLFRYADDLVATFEHRSDADKFMVALEKRFSKYGLELHPDKTRIIEFGRRAWQKSKRDGKKPETFNFLGFTHICDTSRKGKFLVKTKTMSKRLTRALKRIALWCRNNRHQPLDVQSEHLSAVLRGHYQYYGRQGNSLALAQFYRGLLRKWKKWLARRGSGHMTWSRFYKILARYKLPVPKIAAKPTGIQLNFNC